MSEQSKQERNQNAAVRMDYAVKVRTATTGQSLLRQSFLHLSRNTAVRVRHGYFAISKHASAMHEPSISSVKHNKD
ncbi:MAG: hypothetical protein WB784_12600, partial [Rhodanobacteraceae bacterium]